jgi:general stress protein 26
MAETIPAEARAFLEELRAQSPIGYPYCVLAMANAAGELNATPKFAFEVHPDHLWFTLAASTETAPFLRERPRVAVLASDVGTIRAYRFRGDAVLVEAGPDYDRIAAATTAAGFPQPHTVLRVDVDEAARLGPGWGAPAS